MEIMAIVQLPYITSLQMLQIDWEKDQSTGLGNDPVIYDLVSLSDTSSLLVYAYGASSPGLTSYKDTVF